MHPGLLLGITAAVIPDKDDLGLWVLPGAASRDGFCLGF